MQILNCKVQRKSSTSRGSTRKRSANSPHKSCASGATEEKAVEPYLDCLLALKTYFHEPRIDYTGTNMERVR